MCGEHRCPAMTRNRLPGSSPHVRGTPARATDRRTRIGIIPACAGNTWTGSAPTKRRGDHPPHVRGTRRAVERFGLAAGIIPACAGNTLVSCSPAFCRRDHPRMCGEHSHVTLQSLNVVGSSPHVRGTRAKRDVGDAALGIIPACAGNTTSLHKPTKNRRDHPRMCGEHNPIRWPGCSRRGSSPHVRGTPHHPEDARRRTGIIPACAGNTAMVAALM